MKVQRILGSSAAAICFALPAAADVTAAEVWQDWKTLYEGYGYGVTATETAGAGSLTLSDVRLTAAAAEGSSAEAVIPQIVLTERGDGTVGVTMSESFPFTFSAEAEGTRSSGAMDYSAAGFAMVVSGDPGNLSYDYSADSLTLSLRDLEVEGETAEIAAASVTITAMKGNTRSEGTAPRKLTQTMTADSMTYELGFNDPASGKFQMTGTAAPVTIEGRGTLPEGGIDQNDIQAALDAGFAFEGSFAHGGSSVTYSAEGPDGGTGTQTSASGQLKVALVDQGLSYSGSNTQSRLSMTMNQMPLPIEISMADSSFNITVPMGKADAAQDFAFGLRMGDLVVSDMLWGMVDPTGQLPRDPATLVLDLTGKATMFVSLFDQAALASADAPGQFDSVTLRDLVLRVAGAELTGAGAFTFDNADKATIPGMPRPEGAVDLKLTGGNKLLDTLVAMGLVPEDQAMGARMMMGLFAVPAGDDTLTSKIEVNTEGHVLANGQRLR